MKLKISLGEVQKTLLIPLWARAVEYKQPNPLIRDKFAYDMVEMLDFDFSKISEYPEQLRINTVVRAYNFDNALKKFIADHPDATIVNLGAGLDTTFYRVDNGKITWYDLDLPDTMELRRKFIPEGDRNKMITGSIFDRSWFKEIKNSSNVFFMSAGVLVYLKEKDIRSLFLDMIKEFPGSEMMFEIYSKAIIYLQNMSNEKRRREGQIVTPMQWGIRSARPILKWSDRIKLVEQYPFYSRVDLNAHFDPAQLGPIKFMSWLGWIKMVHFKISGF